MDEPPVPQSSLNPYANPFHQLGSTILRITNPEDELLKLELTLRNQRLDQNGTPQPIRYKTISNGQVMEMEVPPLCNEEGVTRIIGLTQSVVSQITVMSNIDDDIIEKIGLNFSDTLIKCLIVNRHKFGITDKSARDDILTSCVNMVYVCLKRGYEEGERRFLKGSTQEITTRIDAQNQKPGLAKSLLGWGSK